MNIFDDGPRVILRLLLSSTDHKYYFTEILDETGFNRQRVSMTLQRLTEAEIVLREPEGYVGESDFRAPRVYYSINPDAFGHLRI